MDDAASGKRAGVARHTGSSVTSINMGPVAGATLNATATTTRDGAAQGERNMASNEGWTRRAAARGALAIGLRVAARRCGSQHRAAGPPAVAVRMGLGMRHGLRGHRQGPGARTPRRRGDRARGQRLRPPRSRESPRTPCPPCRPAARHAGWARHRDAGDHQGHPGLARSRRDVRRAGRRPGGERRHLHPLREPRSRDGTGDEPRRGDARGDRCARRALPACAATVGSEGPRQRTCEPGIGEGSGTATTTRARSIR